MLKNKSHKIIRNLPRVPTTKYLSPLELSSDILFSGYRPITYPMTENPLIKNCDSTASDTNELFKTSINHSSDTIPTMSGRYGTGGIETGGVNGVWKYNPRIPSKLLNIYIWGASSMGMEYYPEWLNVPKDVAMKLRPFQVKWLDKTYGSVPKRYSLESANANKNFGRTWK